MVPRPSLPHYDSTHTSPKTRIILSMIDILPMLRATALLSATALVGVSVLGYGSLGFTVGVIGTLVNLAVLAWLAQRYTGAVQRGEPAAVGLLALHGKTLVVLAALALVGISMPFEPVALGLVCTMTCFTLATPWVALRANTTGRTPGPSGPVAAEAS